MAEYMLKCVFLIALFVTVSKTFKLEQVLVLSRHNIRTPLTEGSKVHQITAQQWPVWTTETGFLTPKGALLESYMGEYFSAWLKREQLLPAGCPKEGTINIYANTRQRTKQSAIAFAKSAFRFCNVIVNFKNITEMDPVFNPVIRNSSELYKNIVLDEMKRKFNMVDLEDAYLKMEKILDYKNSINCLEYNLCSLVSDENTFVANIGEEPNVDGPFGIGNAAADSFLMSYYEGLPLKDIGWGKMYSLDQWELITRFITSNQNVRFNLSHAAKDLAEPLLHYIAETFLRNNETLFTLLVGHDSNLNTVMTALGFKSFELEGQFEKYPVGGKLVFQKFVDDNGEYYLKIEYVYLTSADTRKGKEISLENPPQRVTLELLSCRVYYGGLCPWNEFVMLLKEFI